MFKAGESYQAKITDAGLMETKDGQAQPFMKFKCMSEDEQQEFTWFGSFKSQKATDIAIKALITAGFIGSDVDDLKGGLLMFKEAAIFCELEEDDRQRLKVKWVNGAAKVIKKYEGSTPKLAAAFASARAAVK